MTFFQHTLIAATALAATSLAALPALALDDAQKEEFGAFIREYLIANPEVLIEAQDALEAKQQAAQQEQAGAVIAQSSDAIFNSPSDAAIGNPEGDVTVVEFFDYNCGYCKRAHEDMKAILASDDNVRFVLKEFPILGPDSLAAHRVSMALRKIAPEKYEAFHDALLGGGGRANEAVAIAAAKELGVDEAALKAGMEDAAIDAEIQEAYVLANSLGITGTPSYVVGDEAVFGALGAEVLSEKIGNVRTCDSATC